PFEAHLLLERIFVGDLASCWYTNASTCEPGQPLLQTYGRIVPPLLTIQDTDPPRGLLVRPATGAVHDVLDGLKPPQQRAFQLRDEVSLDRLAVNAFRACPAGWEYELRLLDCPLRITFRTPLPPELIDRDGNPDRLLRSNEPWSLRGRVIGTAYDQLT